MHPVDQKSYSQRRPLSTFSARSSTAGETNQNSRTTPRSGTIPPLRLENQLQSMPFHETRRLKYSTLIRILFRKLEIQIEFNREQWERFHILGIYRRQRGVDAVANWQAEFAHGRSWQRGGGRWEIENVLAARGADFYSKLKSRSHFFPDSVCTALAHARCVLLPACVERSGKLTLTNRRSFRYYRSHHHRYCSLPSATTGRGGGVSIVIERNSRQSK